MHEWKHGESKRSRGGKVKSRRQAVAIALSEAGTKQRHGRIARQQKEGPAATRRKQPSRHGRRSVGPTREQLYRQAMRRKIPGWSRMNRAQLQRALSR
jgi:Family of unknown function (DUF6496)